MDRARFMQLVERFVMQSGLSYQKVANAAGLPKSSVYNWVSKASQPRRWQDIIHFAAALNLSAGQVDQLLTVTDHPALSELVGETQPERVLLQRWQNENRHFLLPRFDLARFTGRDAEIAAARERLIGERQVCVLAGMGGVGKSLLAAEIAHTLAHHFAQGVIWADVRGDESLQGVLHALALPFGLDVANETDVTSRSQLVHHLLAQQDVLIILDNITTAHQIELLLPFQGKCAVLVTTREPTLLTNDQLHAVIHVAPLETQRGVTLLKKMVGDVPITDHDLAKLVSFVAGLPLAIEMIGRFLVENHAFVSTGEYIELLRDEAARLQILDETGGLSRSLQATFEVSYRRLSAEQQHLFSQLGIFATGDFSIAAVTAITGLPAIKVKLGLNALQQRALLAGSYHVALPEIDEAICQRFRIHELMRLFAFQKSATSCAPQHANYFCHFAERFGAGQFAVLDLEWLNIARALAWVAAEQETELLQQGVNGITRIRPGTVGYADSRGYWREAAEHLQTLLATPPDDPFAFAQLHCKRGAFALHLSDWDAAATHLQASQTLYDQLPDSDEVILQRAYLAEFRVRYQINRDNEVAMSELDAAIAALTTVDTPLARHQRGNLQILQGSVLGRMLGLFESAEKAITQGLTQLPKTPSAAQVSAYLNLGTIAFHTGQLASAQDWYGNGVTAATAVGDQRRLATLTLNMGSVAQRQGDLSVAAQRFRDAIVICQRIGNFKGISGAGNNLGVIHYILGETATAETLLQRAIAVAVQYALPVEEAYARTTLGRVYLRQMRWDGAQEMLLDSAEIARQFQLATLLPDVLAIQAELARQRGNLSQAQQRIDQLLPLVTVGQLQQQEGIAWSIQGSVFDDQQRAEAAQQAHEKAVHLLATQDVYELAQAEIAFAQHCLQQQKMTQMKRWLDSAVVRLTPLDAKYDLARIAAIQRRGYARRSEIEQSA